MKKTIVLFMLLMACNEDYSNVYIKDILDVECNMKIQSINKPTQYVFISGLTKNQNKETIKSTFYGPLEDKIKVGDFLIKMKNENIFYVIKENSDTIQIEYTLKGTSLCVNGETIWP